MFINGSLRLCRVAGIDVFVHWSWLLVAYFQVRLRGNTGPFAYLEPRVWNVVEYLTLFGIVLLHEFGHALACRQVGGFVSNIILWPLGGVANVNPPPQPARVLWSIVAGPLVNLLLVPVTVGLLLVSKTQGWEVLYPDLHLYLTMIAVMNAALLIFNLLPIFPLDGGRILHAVLWFFIGRVDSLMVSTILGMVFGVLLLPLAFLALAKGNPWWLLILAFVIYQSALGFRRSRQLSRILTGPRHKEAACPSCGTAPLLGPHWACDECRERFDTFEYRAACPRCGKTFETTRCPECYKSHPIKMWFASAEATNRELQDIPVVEEAGTEEAGERW
jgi:Zn-dependent protease